MAVKKRMNLDISDLPSDLKQQAKQEVAQLIIDSTLEYVSRGESPVGGERTWKQLSEEYANREKGGNRTPNMELSGQMLDNFRSTISDTSENWIEVGIEGGEAEDKAESHNHFSGQGKNPRRRFIPDENQNYRMDIMREVKRIENAKRQEKKRREERQTTVESSLRQENTSSQVQEEINFNISSSEFVGRDRLLDELSRWL